MEYRKRLAADPDHHERFTTIIEFSRGSEHGGYARAFRHLAPEICKRAALIYIDVSYEESVRKNGQRYNPEKPHSILEHSLPDDKLERLYREDDWQALSARHPEFIKIREFSVPYAVFENEDDVTTPMGEALGEKLEQVLKRLWRIYTERDKSC